MLSPGTPSRAILAQGGEMGALIQAYAWGDTPLGSMERWPQSLWSALSICLSTRLPVCIYWGPQYVMLYNDAWRTIPGGRHPWALGKTAPEVWAEIWSSAGVRFDHVFTKGVEASAEDRPMVMTRFGRAEECYFNYTLTPIRDEIGKTAGIFAIATETTYRVVAERRLSLLRELASRAAGLQTVESICQSAAALIQTRSADIPFCLFYLLDGSCSPSVAKLIAACGAAAAHESARPRLIPLNADSDKTCPWPIRRALVSRSIEVVNELDISFDGKLSPAGWQEPIRNAVLVPLPIRSESPSAILVAGAHPGHRLDDAYLNFYELLSSQLTSAFNNARAIESERQRADKIAEIDRAKTAFFSNVSHEFRTPLTLILGPLEAILARPNAISDATRSELLPVQRNAIRLLKLVNTLLDFSRLEAHRYQPRYESVELAAYTAGLAGAFQSICDQANLKLEIDCPALSQPVYVDHEMWEKVVLNLLSNAFKFTPTGSISVRLRPSDDGKDAILTIADTGVGIPSEELPHIFERFHRVERVSGRGHDGSGIGLALVQELVKLNGGSIEVSSTVGQGTEFTVSMPFSRDHLDENLFRDTTAPLEPSLRTRQLTEDALQLRIQTNVHQGLRPETERSFLPFPGQRRTSSSVEDPRARILLAEDNSDMLQFLVNLLSPHYQVIAVSNGDEAIRVLEEDPTAIDLILTDMMMPVMDGLALLRKIRQDPKVRTVPVVILSARAGDEATTAGMDAEADDYVIKPFSPNELLARVRANIRMARFRKEAEEAREKAGARKAERERLALLERLVTVQEQERLRIARELHDQTGQTMTGLALGLKALDAHIADERGRGTLRWLEQLAGEIGQSLHRTAWELRPTSLDDIGLLRALEHYVRDWSERFSIPVDLHGRIDGERFPPKVETTAYRVVQEAMTNVLKHAGASTVSLLLECRDGLLQVIIEDDGRGFDPSSVNCSEHLGLAGMRERLALVGGTLTVDSTVGVGTTLYARIPISPAASMPEKTDA
jgi:signal transduction histidine kinase/GAF domain-containing protein